MSAQPDLPLRPMTLGELLDAAMTLLRARALPLLVTAGVLAGLEQLVLLPFRELAFATAPFYGPARGSFGAWWTLIAVGFATEAFIICVLGSLAAAAAGPALVGRTVSNRQLWSRMRPLVTFASATGFGVICGVAAFGGFVGWVFVYGLFGLVSGVVVIDRAGGGAFLRSARLASRGGLRGVWIRFAAYLSWFAVRVVLGAGWVQILDAFSDGRPGSSAVLTPIAFGLANTVAYAALASVDAVLTLEIRIRTEGLDIAISRARSRGEDEAAPLVWAP
ncbi:hypothetical protein [Actinoplanes sp. TFC3]|uniref:hypothetical protein n=1 Tax=Actinoplanes sp. TFC3 TaxID=1710355 RepID=UPI000836C9B9|nr:hypothetical protein [Actinoplanes sp. TFC3]